MTDSSGLRAALIGLLMGSLAACGGGGDAGFGGSGGGNPDPDPVDPTDPTDPAPVVLRAGRIAGGTFESGALNIDVPALSAGGQTSVRVDIVNEDGTRASGLQANVLFTSDCADQGLAQLTPSPQVTTSSGVAQVTYLAQGCAGTDIVTATVDVASVTSSPLTATGNLTVSPAELGSIAFVSADPPIIGMAGSPIPSQAEVVFRVLDATGAPVRNQDVVFALSSALGGARVTPGTARTGNDGLVTAFVQAGSAPAVIRVIASATNSATDNTVGTQSEALTVSTGFPDQDSVSLAVERFSLDGRCDGEPTTLTMRLADRYNNPTPEGTAVNFVTEGGKINAQCLTGDPLGDPLQEAGVCATLLSVQNPRPPNGRVSVLATALGEEAFTDSMPSNGYYDVGETYEDLAEPFLDNNENGIRDADERTIDTNNNSSFDGASGSFDGYVCTDNPVIDSPGTTLRSCASTQVSVRDSAVVVFSTANLFLEAADVTFFPGPGASLVGNTIVLSEEKAAFSVLITVKDGNGNSLPTGTTFTLVAGIGGVEAPATQGPFNTTEPSSVGYSVIGPEGDEPDRGSLNLRVDYPATSCAGPRSETVGLFSLSYEPPPAP